MKREAPNFLFVMTDQQRADYLGCYGHPVLRTPHIDALADAGTRFTRCHVASPVCMPNRAAFLTGRYPSVNGVRYNGIALSTRAATFVEVLRAGGYRTAHFGKFHVQTMAQARAVPRVARDALGPIEEAWKDEGGGYGEERPERWNGAQPFAVRTPYYGFDIADVVTSHSDRVGGSYYQWLKSVRPDADALRDRANQLPHTYTCPQAYRTPLPEACYPTAYVRDRALDFLDDAATSAQPFFACVSFPDPHHPFTPPGRYWDRYEPGQFAADDLPYEAHANPPPPLAWSQRQLRDGTRVDGSQTEFSATPREIREAKALTCGMLSMIDDAVGALVARLAARGLYENTVIVFTSDHGDYLGDYGLMLKGAMPFAGITRVPLIWSDPRERGARVAEGLASTVDIAPTVLARAGLKPYWGIQGLDLAPLLAGAPRIRDELLNEFEDNEPRFGFDAPAGVRTLLTESWRLSYYRDQPWAELYDLAADPREGRNLWDDPAHRATREALMERLVNRMIATVDPSPRGHWVA